MEPFLGKVFFRNKTVKKEKQERKYLKIIADYIINAVLLYKKILN